MYVYGRWGSCLLRRRGQNSKVSRAPPSTSLWDRPRLGEHSRQPLASLNNLLVPGRDPEARVVFCPSRL
uniref:Uncharacterized protein n=1 Tax=Knipowitschia caucasica TaxID=637954 RepID=A0AAV2JIA3_KNICA